jgi:bacillolysin
MRNLASGFRTSRPWLLIVLFIATWLAPAVPPTAAEPPTPQQVADSLQQQSGGSLDIAWDKETGTPSFITGAISSAGLSLAGVDQSAEPLARAFLSQYAGLYRMHDQATQLVTDSVTQDALGMQHVRFNQVVNGVPVFGGQLVAHIRGQQLTAVNGKFYPQLEVNTVPRLTQAAALARILADIGDPNGEVRADQNGLVIYVDNGTPHLTWKINVYSVKNLGNWLYFVDAVGGQIVHKLNQLEAAKSLKVYTASHGTTLPGTLVCGAGSASDPNCTVTGDLDAQNAFANTGKAYDYYFQTFGRDSYDGHGAQLKSSVHYKTNYKNALWTGTQIVLGDGDTYAQAFDIVAHEMTHAVTDRTSGLIYEHQSGALSESLSDVMAVLAGCSAVTGYADCNWTIGETLSGGAGRDLADPPLYDQPDRWSGYVWWPLESDNGGVHKNSGIPNKAAYLLTTGGTFNSLTVTGLGYTKTEQLYYQAMTHYLTTYSDFMAMRLGLATACNDELGNLGITPDDCKQVANAWAAVGIGNSAEAPVLAGPNLVFLPVIKRGVTPPINCSASNPIQNGSFESGTAPWTFLGFTDIYKTGWAYNGTHIAEMPMYLATGYGGDGLMQTINIPEGRTALRISFYVMVAQGGNLSYAQDKLLVSLQPEDSVSLTEVWTVDNLYSTDSYPNPFTYWHVTLTYNEMPYAGRPMRVYIHPVTSGYNDTIFWVDAVSVQMQCTRYAGFSADQAAAPVVVQIEPAPNPSVLNAANWSQFKRP